MAWGVADNPANTTGSSAITVIADKSGGGFTATPLGSVANNKGVWGVDTLNARNLITAGSSASALCAFTVSGGITLSNNTGGMTLFSLHSLTSGGTLIHNAKNADPTRTRIGLSRSTTTPGDLELGVRRLDSDSYTAVNDGVTSYTGWQLACGIADYANAKGHTWMNGTAHAANVTISGPGNTSATDAGASTLFCYDNNGASDLCVGKFAEWLVIRGTLTPSQRQQVEGYMMWAWGLQASLPAGHPYLSAAPTDVNIIEAAAAIDGDGGYLWTASKVLAGLYAETDDAANAYLAAKILAAVYADTGSDVEAWGASAVSSMSGTITADSTWPVIGGAIGAGVMDGTSSNTSLFDSNAIASSGGDFTCGLDGTTLWLGSAIAGMLGDVQGQTDDLFVSGKTVAAAFSADDLDAQDVFVAGFILTSMATLIGDCLVEWSTAAFPGDHGAIGPAASNRRMQRNPTSRVMVRVGPIRKMTR